MREGEEEEEETGVTKGAGGKFCERGGVGRWVTRKRSNRGERKTHRSELGQVRKKSGVVDRKSGVCRGRDWRAETGRGEADAHMAM